MLDNDRFIIQAEKVRDLRYGENPSQVPAGLFRLDPLNPLSCPLALHNFQIIEGDPGYVNLTDLDRGLHTMIQIVNAFRAYKVNQLRSIAMGLKHGNCCGAAVSHSPHLAMKAMISGQPNDLFGGVVLTNFPINKELAVCLKTHSAVKRVIDVLAASDITKKAREVLSRKGEKCKIMVNPWLKDISCLTHKASQMFRPVLGGLLSQPENDFVLKLDDERMERVGELSEEQKNALLLAWAIGSTSDSNTITLVKYRHGTYYLAGNGVRQTSRVAAARVAIDNAKAAGHDLDGAVAYSDSFFPFVDGPELLAKAGIKAIFATSGSIQDKAVTECCRKYGVTLWRLSNDVARGFFHH